MAQPVDQVARTMAECTGLFFALGDPMRQQIILRLVETESCNVNELAAGMVLSRPAISHHLKILRRAGLVAMQPKGTENHYSLTMDDALELLRRFVHEVEACEQ